MWLVFKENSLFWPPPFGDKINNNFFSMKKNFFEIIIRVLIISAQTCLNKKSRNYKTWHSSRSCIFWEDSFSVSVFFLVWAKVKVKFTFHINLLFKMVSFLVLLLLLSEGFNAFVLRNAPAVICMQSWIVF